MVLREDRSHRATQNASFQPPCQLLPGFWDTLLSRPSFYLLNCAPRSTGHSIMWASVVSRPALVVDRRGEGCKTWMGWVGSREAGQVYMPPVLDVDDMYISGGSAPSALHCP